MKKLFNLSLIILTFLIGFSACHDDKEDFVTDADVAKEMIKGTWTMESMWIDSNYQEFDKQINNSFNVITSLSTTTFYFDGEYVTSKMISTNGAFPTEENKDPYYFKDNLLYINDVMLNKELAHTFRISKKTMELKFQLTKSILLELIKDQVTGDDYNQIKDAIPSNFSGYMIYKLKK